MKVLVTGGCGFIGSHLADRLLARGDEVVVLDNLSSGRRDFVAHHAGDARFSLRVGDLLDPAAVREAVRGADMVFHLATNPDVRLGAKDTTMDLRQGVEATRNVLDAMRLEGVRDLAFASSSTVYGESLPVPTREDMGPLLPISMYGAGKLGAEAFVSAFAGTFGLRAWIFRFANVIGPRGTHGVIVDFVDKLKRDPTRLEILGDGLQRKSYLMVDELVDGMLHLVGRAPAEPVAVLNLGSGDNVPVRRIAELVVERLGLRDVRFDPTGGARGWPGDVPVMLLDVSAAARHGWRPKRSSEEAVREAVDAVVSERW